MWTLGENAVHILAMVVVGLMLLTLGWRLFWLVIGAVGFVAGLQAAQWVFGPQPYWILWLAGLGCGIIGAILALFFQKLAIGIGGFMAGSTIAIHLMLMMGFDASALVAMIGGVAGALALFMLFDWTLILLSSVVGTTFIIEAIGRQTPYSPMLAALLIVGGVIFQARLLIVSRKRGH